MTPEGVVKNAVKKVLTSYGAYYYMPVPGGFGKQSLDFIGCHEGRFFAVETKAPGKKPTKRQELTILDIQRAKGPAFVIDGDEGLNALREWLDRRG